MVELNFSIGHPSSAHFRFVVGQVYGELQLTWLGTRKMTSIHILFNNRSLVG